MSDPISRSVPIQCAVYDKDSLFFRMDCGSAGDINKPDGEWHSCDLCRLPKAIVEEKP